MPLAIFLLNLVQRRWFPARRGWKNIPVVSRWPFILSLFSDSVLKSKKPRPGLGLTQQSPPCIEAPKRPIEIAYEALASSQRRISLLLSFDSANFHKSKLDLAGNGLHSVAKRRDTTATKGSHRSQPTSTAAPPTISPHRHLRNPNVNNSVPWLNFNRNQTFCILPF